MKTNKYINSLMKIIKLASDMEDIEKIKQILLDHVYNIIKKIGSRNINKIENIISLTESIRPDLKESQYLDNKNKLELYENIFNITIENLDDSAKAITHTYVYLEDPIKIIDSKQYSLKYKVFSQDDLEDYYIEVKNSFIVFLKALKVITEEFQENVPAETNQQIDLEIQVSEHEVRSFIEIESMSDYFYDQESIRDISMNANNKLESLTIILDPNKLLEIYRTVSKEDIKNFINPHTISKMISIFDDAIFDIKRKIYYSKSQIDVQTMKNFELAQNNLSLLSRKYNKIIEREKL